MSLDQSAVPRLSHAHYYGNSRDLEIKQVGNDGVRLHNKHITVYETQEGSFHKKDSDLYLFGTGGVSMDLH